MASSERSESGFSTLTVALMPVAIALNMVVGEIVARLQLPVYLDSIGTVITAALAGPWAGAVAGGLTNILWGLLFGRVTAMPFAITAFVIGLIAGFLARWGFLGRWWLTAIGGIITGLVAAVVSAPIAAYLFGGITGGGTDIIVAYLLASGANILQATLGQGIASDPLDKLITFLVVWTILRALPRRLVYQFPGANKLRGRS